jgi:DNA-binding HxlR family transcriptional regulator
MINRILYPEVPPRVEYEPTPLGRSLEPFLLSMRQWGADFVGIEQNLRSANSHMPSHLE